MKIKGEKIFFVYLIISLILILPGYHFALDKNETIDQNNTKIQKPYSQNDKYSVNAYRFVNKALIYDENYQIPNWPYQGAWHTTWDNPPNGKKYKVEIGAYTYDSGGTLLLGMNVYIYSGGTWSLQPPGAFNSGSSVVNWTRSNHSHYYNGYELIIFKFHEFVASNGKAFYISLGVPTSEAYLSTIFISLKVGQTETFSVNTPNNTFDYPEVWKCNANTQPDLLNDQVLDYFDCSEHPSGNYDITVHPTALDHSTEFAVITEGWPNNYVLFGELYVEPITGFIDVNLPQSGDVFYKDESLGISWTSSDCGPYVKIDLYKGTTFAKNLLPSTPNDGSAVIQLTPDLASAADYKVRITDLSNTNIFDDSGEFIIIYSPTGVVINPESGDAWEKGKSYTITWNWDSDPVFNPNPKADIELWKGDTNVATIASDTANNKGNNSYLYMVSQSLSNGNDYKIKIKAKGTHNSEFESGNFEIDGNKPPVAILKADPIQGEIPPPLTVNFDGSDSYDPDGGDIQQYYFDFGDGKNSNWISSSTTSHDYDTGGTYYTKLMVIDDEGSKSEWSDSVTITVFDEWFISITSPKQEDVFYKDESWQVSWSSFGCGPKVKIDLYKGDLLFTTLSTETDNDGSQSLSFPSSLQSATDYKIKITDLSDTEKSGLSENFVIISKPSGYVISPKNGDIWKTGTGNSYDIEWNWNNDPVYNPCPKADIELWLGSQFIEKIAFDITNNNGSNLFPYTFSSNLTDSTEYFIKIKAKGKHNHELNSNKFQLGPGDNIKAILKADPIEGTAPLPVSFDGLLSYPEAEIKKYYFDFGDEKNSGWINSSNTTHKYDNAGIYYAKLQVKDEEGFLSPWSEVVKITVFDNATVEGRVTDESGNGMFGVTIFLDGDTDYTTKTDVNGSFYIKDINQDTYTCIPSFADHYFEPESRDLVIDAPKIYSLEFKGFDIPYKDIHGRIVDSGGIGKGGIPVEANGKKYKEYRKITTDSNGRFKLEGLRPDTYKIQPVHSGFGFKPPSKEATIISSDIFLEDIIAYPTDLKIGGHILTYDGEDGISNVKVGLSGDGTSTENTNSTGYFQFEGLQKGNYRITPKPIDKDQEFTPKYLDINLGDYDFLKADFKEDWWGKEIKVGDLTVSAERIKKTGKNRYQAIENVRIGDLIEASGDLNIDLDKIEISGNCTLKLTGIPFISSIVIYSGSFKIHHGRIDEILASIPSIQLYGFSFKITHIGFAENKLTVGASLELPPFLKSIKIDIDIRFSKQGIDLDFDSYIPTITIPNTNWELGNTRLKFVSREQIFEADTSMKTPVFGVEGGIKIKEGEVTSVSIGAEFRQQILPGVFLNKISGSLENINQIKNLIIRSNASLSGGPEINIFGKTWSVLSTDLEIVIQISNHFTGRGTLYVLTFEIAHGEINFIPEKQIEAKGDFNALNIVKVDASMVVDKSGVRGQADCQLIIPKKFFWGWPPYDYPLANIIGEFNNTKLILNTNFYFLLKNWEIEVVISPGKVCFIKPIPWCWEIGGSPEGYALDSVFQDMSKREHELPAGLRKAVFITNWTKGDTDPKLKTPSGLILTRSSNLPGVSYYKDKSIKLAVYEILQPEAGIWTFLIPNPVSVGKTKFYVAKYEQGPSFTFKKVAPAGNDYVKIEWTQSREDDSKVTLLYGAIEGGKSKFLIAAPGEIGKGNLEWLWDISKVKPGQYYIYSRLSSSNSAPLTLRYDVPIQIHAAPGIKPPRNFKVNLKNDVLHVKWTHKDKSEIEYFKLYYREKATEKNFKNFISYGSDQKHIILDTEYLKSGRRYKIAMSAFYKTQQESKLSPVKKVTYRLNKENNLPTFTSIPKTTAIVNRDYKYVAAASDIDKDEIYYALQQSPFGMRIDFISGEVTWRPEKRQLGDHLIQLLAVDSRGGVEVQEFKISVVDPETQGGLELRPLNTSIQSGLLVVYRNGNLNLEKEKIEEIKAAISGYYSVNEMEFTLYETDHSSGIFTAFLPVEQIQRIVYAPYQLRPATTASLSMSSGFDAIVIKIKGEYRQEKETFRYLY